MGMEERNPPAPFPGSCCGWASGKRDWESLVVELWLPCQGPGLRCCAQQGPETVVESRMRQFSLMGSRQTHEKWRLQPGPIHQVLLPQLRNCSPRIPRPRVSHCLAHSRTKQPCTSQVLVTGGDKIQCGVVQGHWAWPTVPQRQIPAPSLCEEEGGPRTTVSEVFAFLNQSF